MAAKKKTKSKKTASKKAAPKKKAPEKKLLKRKTPPKKNIVKAKSVAKKASREKSRVASTRPVRGNAEDVDTLNFTPVGRGARSAGQSGSLQGLSDVESADSESVDELIEEGNAFEAEVIKGVEDAPDEEEVHTHEVPEDDVPGEYDDQ
jgi:hypothetical protein